ncbi:DNRLRE domain-containing protein [Micromonospora sp. NPDC049679]|uniref:CBM96 family carbohydrate-binding protein n=1 Tax=Micromonospora sp. NPDC049679 TaxID=3155920 RepID=UPI0033CDE2F0
MATQELGVRASDDSYTSTARRSYNGGQATKLEVGRIGRDTRVTYLKFTVGKLGSGASVAGAQLRLVTDGRALPGTLTLARVADTKWTEKTVTA